MSLAEDSSRGRLIFFRAWEGRSDREGCRLQQRKTIDPIDYLAGGDTQSINVNSVRASLEGVIRHKHSMVIRSCCCAHSPLVGGWYVPVGDHFFQGSPREKKQQDFRGNRDLLSHPRVKIVPCCRTALKIIMFSSVRNCGGGAKAKSPAWR